MIKTTLLGIGAAALMSLSVGGAQAMPLAQAPAAAPLVENVAMGCGPGFFRGPRGFCRPMVGRPFYGPGRYWGGRRYYGRPGWRRGWHRW